MLVSRNIVSAVVSESGRRNGHAAAGGSSSSSRGSSGCFVDSLAVSGIGGAAAVAIYGPSLDDCVFFRSDEMMAAEVAAVPTPLPPMPAPSRPDYNAADKVCTKENLFVVIRG